MPLPYRAQISTEYLIVVGFVSFLIIGVLGVALYYSNSIRDQLAFSNLDRFAYTVVSHAEDVFYAGEPSKITIRPYLPAGVTNITVGDDYILISFQTHSGLNTRAYTSEVPLTGSLSTVEGIKRIQLFAQSDGVLITED